MALSLKFDLKDKDDLAVVIIMILCIILAIVQYFLDWGTNIGFFEGLVYSVILGIIPMFLWVDIFSKMFKGPPSE